MAMLVVEQCRCDFTGCRMLGCGVVVNGWVLLCKDVLIRLLDVAFRHTYPDLNCSICLSLDSQFPAHSNANSISIHANKVSNNSK